MNYPNPAWILCQQSVAALLLWSMATVPARGADDDAEATKAEKLAGVRLAIMRETIDGFQIKPMDAESEPALTFSARPLLRYNDQTRESGQGIKGVLDATVWHLSETGRPKAIVTLEIYLVNEGSPLLTYEFVSLTPEKFDMRSARGVRWIPHSTDLSMTEFDEAPTPADTPRARLAQMRELARRFTCQEKLQGQKISLRMLPQPIDRYDDAAANVADGGLFIFANGTNPELALLLECSNKQWSYGIFRLTSATLLSQLDGKWILQSTKPPGYPVDAPYTATRHSVILPE